MRETWGMRAKRFQDAGDQVARDRQLRIRRRNIQTAEQPFFILQHIKGVAGGSAFLHGGIAGQRFRIDEFFDQLE